MAVRELDEALKLIKIGGESRTPLQESGVPVRRGRCLSNTVSRHLLNRIHRLATVPT